METIIFEELNDVQKKVLLEALEFKVADDGQINDKTGKPHICPFSNKKVYVKNASILPGSTIVINTSSLTLSEYITKYVDV